MHKVKLITVFNLSTAAAFWGDRLTIVTQIKKPFPGGTGIKKRKRKEKGNNEIPCNVSKKREHRGEPDSIL